MDSLRARAETTGYFTRTDALAAGHDDRSIRRAVQVKLWRRLRNGAYTFADLCPEDPRVLHRLTAHAAAEKLGSTVALSHVSAAIEHDLELWEPDLSLVHVTRLDAGAGRTEAGVVHHEAFTTEDDLVVVGGRRVTSPARAAIEAASLGSAEAALVVLDSVLHRRLATPDELRATYETMQHWPGMRSQQLTVRMADGRAASVGESRSRYLFFAMHLPAPRLQYDVFDECGGLVGTSDFAWPGHRLLGEFDGRVKYERYRRPGESPGDTVFREKRREDRLTELTGFRMVRLVWADLHDPLRTAGRIRRLLADAA